VKRVLIQAIGDKTFHLIAVLTADAG